MQVIAPMPPMPPMPQMPPDAFQSGPPEKVIIGLVIIVGLILAGVILAPLIKALARRIEGKSVDAGLAAEIDHLRTRVAELEGVQDRMAELEERVDFSERLLAQGREQAAIAREK